MSPLNFKGKITFTEDKVDQVLMLLLLQEVITLRAILNIILKDKPSIIRKNRNSSCGTYRKRK